MNNRQFLTPTKNKLNTNSGTLNNSKVRKSAEGIFQKKSKYCRL